MNGGYTQFKPTLINPDHLILKEDFYLIKLGRQWLIYCPEAVVTCASCIKLAYRTCPGDHEVCDKYYPIKEAQNGGPEKGNPA